MRTVMKKKKEEWNGLGMATVLKRGGGMDLFPSVVVVTAVALSMIVGAASSSEQTFYGRTKNKQLSGPVIFHLASPNSAPLYSLI